VAAAVAVCANEVSEQAMDESDILRLNGPAFRLAAHILGSTEDAQDAVQTAYLAALLDLRKGVSPDDLRAWFLKVVANVARMQLRGESRRRRREVAAMMESRDGSSGGVSAELVAALRKAIAALDEKYRLPVVLCCEEGLSQREAAAVLDMPESTVNKYVTVGLERLHAALSRAGYAVVPATVLSALVHTAPAVPATLAATLGKIVSGQMPVVGSGSGSAGAAVGVAAKGGIAMKILVSVVAAGVLAGAAGLSAFGFRLSEPRDTGGGPAAAAVADGKPAPVNEFKGMQEREEVFEFTQKPAVTKQGDKWVIAFASKGKCDATVSIVDKDGKIVRHLASGVLGANAPHPFQQNSLSQKIEWDGLTTDFKKADAAGCKVKVSLGLQAKYDRSIAYDPAYIPNPKPLHPRDDPNHGSNGVLVGTGADGLVYVANQSDRTDAGCVAFDKDGKYVKTVVPPSGTDIEKAAAALGMKLSTTKWGDKVLVCDWFGPFAGMKSPGPVVTKLVPGLELKPSAPPANLQSNKAEGVGVTNDKIPHMVVDRARDEVYVQGGSTRFIGKTGELDKTWMRDPKKGGVGGMEFSVGADGLVYFRVGPYGNWLIRLDREGKPVPFKPENTAHVPGAAGGGGWWNRVPSAFKDSGMDGAYCGVIGYSFTHQSGLYAAPNGMIVAGIHEVSAKWAADVGITGNTALQPGASVASVKSNMKSHENGIFIDGKCIKGNYNPVFDSDGKLLSANSVGETSYGQGVTMDRDGNIYTVFGGVAPAGQSKMDASDLPAPLYRQQGGSGTLVKFRGLGGKFPLKVGPGVKVGKDELPGALWAYGGMSGQSGGDCQCHHMRHDMDFFARSFIPSGQLYSVTVLDSNMNRVARFGRYGNVDDSEDDIKTGKGDGIRIAWMRAVAASDVALYVVDPGNRRILRAALSYAAEETVPVP
jgi:RNA polymerase sigma factor (sigma-70 family)